MQQLVKETILIAMPGFWTEFKGDRGTKSKPSKSHQRVARQLD
jgi:hypothetical protein